MAAFIPGESPPEVRTPILVTFLAMNNSLLDVFINLQIGNGIARNCLSFLKGGPKIRFCFDTDMSRHFTVKKR